MRNDSDDHDNFNRDDFFRTVAGRGLYEMKVERSAFIAQAGPAASEDEARAFVAAVRTEHRDATHNCFAWRIGHTGGEGVPEATSEYFNDQGEPSGTAGRPILGAISRLGLTDTVVVVTRYFGGKKLGVRGLIESYGQAATGALEAAGAVTRENRSQAAVAAQYADYSTLLHRLERHGARVEGSYFGAEVELVISAATSRLPAVIAELEAERLIRRLERDSGVSQ